MTKQVTSSFMIKHFPLLLEGASVQLSVCSPAGGEEVSVQVYSSAVSVSSSLRGSKGGHGGGAGGKGGGAVGLGVALGLEVFAQPVQLLLPLSDELVQVPLADHKRRLHVDEAPVLVQLRPGQVPGQDVQDQALPSVQVLLQLPGVLVLTAKLPPPLLQGLLKTCKNTPLPRRLNLHAAVLPQNAAKTNPAV